jgi:hypothetical protein
LVADVELVMELHTQANLGVGAKLGTDSAGRR